MAVSKTEVGASGTLSEDFVVIVLDEVEVDTGVLDGGLFSDWEMGTVSS
jgi:hypothetical protein